MEYVVVVENERVQMERINEIKKYIILFLYSFKLNHEPQKSAQIYCKDVACESC